MGFAAGRPVVGDRCVRLDNRLTGAPSPPLPVWRPLFPTSMLSMSPPVFVHNRSGFDDVCNCLGARTHAMKKASARRITNDALRKGVTAIAPAFATAIIFSFFLNLLMFVSPLYMLQIYDRVLGTRNLATLGGLTVIAAALLMVWAGAPGDRQEADGGSPSR